MTNPINRHCKAAIEYIRLLKIQQETTFDNHDPGDEDPRAWDNEMEND